MAFWAPVVLGGGLLVLTTLYELIRRKEAFGGGDIKLMAVLGLFLGLERGVVCLLTACLLSVAYVLGREFGRRVMKNRRDRSTALSRVPTLLALERLPSVSLS